MATLKVGKSLTDTDVLWRYLPLDKFIDFLESRTLFFTPLAWFEKTDLFEDGFPANYFSPYRYPASKEKVDG